MPERQDRLTGEELEAQTAEALPDKEAMSRIDLGGLGIDNFAMPINEAIAINNDSTQAWAIADADQVVILDQSDTDAAAD